MNRRRTQRRNTTRQRTIVAAAGLTAFLMVFSAAAAWAWTASNELTVHATAASTDIAMSDEGTTVDGLDGFTYDPAVPALATVGEVTVTNHGTRTATYQLAVAGISATSGLAASVDVEIWKVSVGEPCAVATNPAVSTTGTLAGSGTTFSGGAEELAADGGEVVLCVRTSMDLLNAGLYPEKQVDLTLQSQLQYANDADWRIGSLAATATQYVAEGSSLGVGRYTVTSTTSGGQTGCLFWEITSSSPGNQLYVLFDRTDTCAHPNQDEWRLVDASPTTGVEATTFLNAATNNLTESEEPRWTEMPDGAAVETIAPDFDNSALVDRQAWILDPIGGGKFHVVNSTTGMCAAVSDDIKYGSVHYVDTVTCDEGDPSQSFAFAAVGNPAPEVETLACTAGNAPYSISVAWSSIPQYDQETSFAVYLEGVDASNRPTGAFVEYVEGGTVVGGGSWSQPSPALNFNSNDARLLSYWNAVLTGSVAQQVDVVVYRSINGGEWNEHATGSVWLKKAGSEVQVGCAEAQIPGGSGTETIQTLTCPAYADSSSENDAAFLWNASTLTLAGKQANGLRLYFVTIGSSPVETLIYSQTGSNLGYNGNIAFTKPGVQTPLSTTGTGLRDVVLKLTTDGGTTWIPFGTMQVTVTHGSTWSYDCGNTVPTPTPTPTPTSTTPPTDPPASTPGMSVTPTSSGSWGGGGGYNFAITNGTGHAINGWSVTFTIAGLTSWSYWNATCSTVGTTVTCTSAGFDWNKAAANGATASFGGNYDTSGSGAISNLIITAL